MSSLNTWLPAILSKRVDDDASALQIAEALFTILLAIDTALIPALGQRNITLLFERSLDANIRLYPWMAAARKVNYTRHDLAAVTVHFAHQRSEVAVAGGRAFLQSFYDLLVACIGLSLTEQLLRSVWANNTAP